MNQKTEYAILAKNLTYKDLPILRAMQYKRAAMNINAGLELGLSKAEAIKMAAEDFATPAEKLAEAELRAGYEWLRREDWGEVHQMMRALDIFPKRRN